MSPEKPKEAEVEQTAELNDEFPLANVYPIFGTNDAGARARGLSWSWQNG